MLTEENINLTKNYRVKQMKWQHTIYNLHQFKASKCL